jgi:hypothetical protein
VGNVVVPVRHGMKDSKFIIESNKMNGWPCKSNRNGDFPIVRKLKKGSQEMYKGANLNS